MSPVAHPNRGAQGNWRNALLLALIIWSAASSAHAEVVTTAQRLPPEAESRGQGRPSLAVDPETDQIAHAPLPGDSLDFPAPALPGGELPAMGSEPVAGEFDFSVNEPGHDVTWSDEPLEEMEITEAWDWQMLPDGLIYRSYLAGAKESRMASFWAYEKDEGWIWDNTLGGRVGIWRYGTNDSFHPEGWQMDIEGAALLRLDTEEERDLVAADFRFGIPLTYGVGRYQTKIAYYHLSSHLGDEYSLKHPEFSRINYSRDVFVWGHSYFLTDDLRVYGEAGYAFFHDVSEPWEFQFGLDYSPAAPSGIYGAPFFAFNGALREEVDFGGNLVVQVGRQWRGAQSGHLFRAGIEYYNGKSDQFEFFDQFEEKIGIAIWYDF